MLLLGLVDIPLFVLLIPCAILLLYIYGTYPLGRWRKLGVPGPDGLPFIGNIRDIYNKEIGMRKCLEQWQKKYGHIYGITFYRAQVLVVSDHEALRQVFVKDFNNYIDRMHSARRMLQPIIRKGLFFNGGLDWQRIRRIMTPTFSSGKLKQLMHQINRNARQLSDSLIKKAETGTEVEAKQSFAAFSLDVIASTAFGLDLDSQNNPDNLFMAHAKGLMTIDPSLKKWQILTGVFPIFAKVFRALDIGFFKRVDVAYFHEQMRSLLQEKRNNPEQFPEVNFIRLLMEAEASPSDELVGSKKLSQDEVAAQCIVFIIAGYETSSSTLQFLAHQLAHHQEVQNKLIQEIKDVVGDDEEVTYEHCQKLKYTEAAINEALRLFPPVHYINRESNNEKTLTLQGITVPPNTRIMIPLYGLGRDPECFEDPDMFKPERFLGENKHKTDALSFIPFGFGPRQCIGMRMAMIQLKLALVHVLRKVNIVEASPKNLEFHDFTGLLVPQELIKLKLIKTYYGTYPLGRWRKLGVPGPDGLPFIGNIRDIYNKEIGMRKCLDQWQKKYGRIYGITFYRAQVLVVSDHEALRQVFVKDFNNYIDRMHSAGRMLRPIIRKGLFFTGGLDWQRIRRIMTPTFSSGKLKQLMHQINRNARQLSDSLIKKAETGTEVEAKQSFAAFSLDVIASTAFGLDLDSQNNPDNLFMAHAKGLVTIDPSLKKWLILTGVFPIFAKLLRALDIGFFKRVDVAYFHEQMRSLLQEKRNNPEQFPDVNFIRLLMEAEASPSDEIVGSKKLSQDEVAAQCIVFIIAGYETSSSTLQFLAHQLAHHQEVQNKLIQEIKDVVGDDEEVTYEHCQKLKYTEAAINEALRLFPPVHYINRESNNEKTLTLQGITMPPNTRIMIPLYGLGRDPECFEDPDMFKPERFLGENKHKTDALSFIPFGFGPRQCIGMRMAMIQLKLALVHVLRKVNIVEASPKNLEFHDFTGLLVPQELIKLKLVKTS